ncbi:MULTISPECIES: precorrin-4 C(11)-methyltransferase [Bacteroides]|uniref:precorrin-4 C(11)-methyltransferase n=1 Tax=Bacteroides TaxID=816 RepID=UPI001DD6D087|nr:MULTISPECIES: precorrin-4 C(11)-methyltransferase [Bacteroides]HJD93181.1 precorrin-4 C(11)-methyltransferase [Bacteroides coprosuis]
MKHAIILTSKSALGVAQTIQESLIGSTIYSKHELENCQFIPSISDCVADLFDKVDSILFIGAMGICVRAIAPHIKDKHTDPAIICIDSTGKSVISVLSGHVGGANELTEQIARILGTEPVITTQSDNNNLWALDTIGKKYNWVTRSNVNNFNQPLTRFVNKEKTALFLNAKDEGTAYLERTKPEHVDIFYKYEDINFDHYQLFIAVTPYIYPDAGIDTISFHNKAFHLGVGCRKNCNATGIAQHIENYLNSINIATDAIQDISSIDIKKDEPLLKELSEYFGKLPIYIYSAEELEDVNVPNPSEKVKEVTQSPSVSEASAIRSAHDGILLVEKQKGVFSEGNDFTFALAIDPASIRQGHIEIVGAGPGDPELVSVRGKRFLEEADLILYAGSLVPVELTHYAKKGAVVRSSAAMTLEEQFAIMKEFYDKDLLVVRLHTGDPCIYGAIQEQMAFFDEYNMSYHITPGISSFQAAAAELRSQFTIPEKVQTIILTRGEGRTPMPEKEQLHMLAKSQSTMCIFLSASIVDKVQEELLVHYPPTTPVAACYKLTWKDQKIFRGQLKDLAQIVKGNNLTLTTMIVVGEAIDNRKGVSKLYSHKFRHLFRK